MKKLWEKVSIKKISSDSFCVMLDKRILKTPLKRELVLPNLNLAQEIVKEWDQDSKNINTESMIFYGLISTSLDKIIDNKNGELFDKMLSSIKLDRKQISLASYIPRGIGEFENDHKMITTLQLINYRLIELINPKYLIIMSNYCIKMLLAADLSSMSLRGKWFDFNTPNDVVPKKCRVLYEPSLLINNPDLKKDAWEDLKEIKKQLGG